MLDRKLWKRFELAASARHIKLIFPSSASISEIIIATTRHYAIDYDAVINETLNLRILHRVITAKQF